MPPSAERDHKDLELHILLGRALVITKEYGAPETLQVFLRARDLLGEANTAAEYMTVLWGLFHVHWSRVEFSAAREVAGQCMALAKHHDYPPAFALANRLIGMTLDRSSALEEARYHLQQAVDYYAANQEQIDDLRYAADDQVVALYYLTNTLWVLGFPKEAAATSSQAVIRAQSLGHANTTVAAMTGEIEGECFYGGDIDRAATLARQLVVLAEENGIRNDWASFLQGTLSAKRGDLERGIVEMRRAMTAAQAVRHHQPVPRMLTELAAAYSRYGQPEVGLGLLDEAIQSVEKTGATRIASEIYRVRGELLLASGRKGEAEVELERALSLARVQKARWWELRAATTLAQHWQREGRYAEARDLLAPVYNWFTEGLDLPDLKGAKAVLEELGGKTT